MKLSVLEQSTLSEGSLASDAINNTVTVAKEIDTLRFERLWLSEHHNMNILQGSSPEVLLSAIGASTSRIRIGSGGVMLPNHSAYKVAENFRVLEALYPGRVDCGVGRAGGGDPHAISFLNPPTSVGFPEQVEHLEEFLHDECRMTLAMPTVRSVPVLWLLSAGSRPGSGLLAAKKGMGLAVALFINPEASAEAVRVYRENFVPSRELPEPYVIIAVNFACATTPEKLAELKKASDYFRIMRDSGTYPSAVPSPATLAQISFNDRQLDYLRQISNREIIALAQDVGAKIKDRAAAYNADEVMLTMMSYDLGDKLDAFRLAAQSIGIA